MRIRLLSDLHLRHGDIDLPPVEADVTVLAGDINRGTRGIAWAQTMFPEHPVLYVYGNHEFYRQHLPSVRAAGKAMSAQPSAQVGVHVLDNSEWIHQSVAFLGTTLWTDFSLFGQQRQAAAMAATAARAPDFKLITTGSSDRPQPLTPHDVQSMFQHAFAWLEQRVAYHQAQQRKTCIITHFAPSVRSLAPRFADDLVSAYFINPLDAWIQQHQPDLWIHGHTHDHFDYSIGRTRILCNPRGYPNEYEQHGFNPALVISV